MSDLCWICQSNCTAIMRAVNQPEEQKSAVRTIPHFVIGIAIVFVYMNYMIWYRNVL